MLKINENQSWDRQGNDYFLQTSNDPSKLLPKGVYTLCYAMGVGIYLVKSSDKLSLPSKIYNVEEDFINRVLESWDKLDRKTIAALLSGYKGTGKSITAKIIANRTDKPIIIINSPINGFSSFLNRIEQEKVVLIDEYEKIFEFKSNENDTAPIVTELLGYLDGIESAPTKTLVVLTSNNDNVNTYLRDRPGRIRYRKSFTGLSDELIKMIIEDKLRDKTKQDEVYTIFNKIDIPSVDILTAFLEEVNTHNTKTPESLVKNFNFTMKEAKNRVVRYALNNNREIDFMSMEIIASAARSISPSIEHLAYVRDPKLLLREELVIDGIFQGKIVKVTDNLSFIVAVPEKEDIIEIEEDLAQIQADFYHEESEDEDEEDEDSEPVARVIVKSTLYAYRFSSPYYSYATTSSHNYD